MRQPIESGEIVISRVGATLNFPCRFTLVAAMNPCPCGYFGSDMCRCKDTDVKKYQKKLSGPILDRIDLQVEMDRLSTEERFAPIEEDLSARLRMKVERARDRQIARFAGKGIPYNAAIPGGTVLDYCEFSSEAMSCFKETIENNTLSTRSMDRLAKVARTIADLDGIKKVQAVHIRKATTFVVGGVLRESL